MIFLIIAIFAAGRGFGLLAYARDAMSIVIGALILAATSEPMRRMLAKYPPLAKNRPS